MNKKVKQIIESLEKEYQYQGVFVDSLDIDDKNREYFNGIRHGIEKALIIILELGEKE